MEDSQGNTEIASVLMNELFKLIFENKEDKDAFFDELYTIVETHPKLKFAERWSHKIAIQAFKASDSVCKLLSADFIQRKLKQYWKYRKLITSRLVPGPDTPTKDEELFLSKSVILSLFTRVVHTFSSEKVERLFQLLEKLVSFFEPIAIKEGWNTDLLPTEGLNWVPLSTYLQVNKNGRRRRDTSVSSKSKKAANGLCSAKE